MNITETQEDKIKLKIESLLSKMTLLEKIGQMNQYNGFWDATGPVPAGGDNEKKYNHLRQGLVGSMLNVRGVKEVRAVQKIAVEESRLGIPLIIGFDVIHGYKTMSPIPLAEAASWDMELIRKSAAVAAAEAAASGINWTFAPMVDISRDARWGRIMEGAGEDPYLGSQIAKARVKGFQGDDLAATDTVAACAKHFAAYGFAEAGREYNTADVGEATLHNIIFPPFQAAIEADVKTIMNSFNELNGIPATGDAFLQREILKGKWNYQGFVISDWDSINEMQNHGYAKDGKDAALKAVTAGSDMDMEANLYIAHLEALVKEGKVSETLIDDAVARILRVKFELGLFDDPYKYCDEAREKTTLGKPEFQETVLEMAKKSIVLLKNDENLLPLGQNGLKLALIGPLAADKNSPLGSWRLAADNDSAVSVLEGLQQYPSNEIIHAMGTHLVEGDPDFVHETYINTANTDGFAEAINAATAADVVVMVLGEYGYQSGEGRSRVNLDLPGVQQALLEEIHKVNKKIVLVLMNGRPLTLGWAHENIPAILETWHLGTQSGHAIAQTLYGAHNPGGKLPMSFPRHVGQVPLYYNQKNTGRPQSPAPNQVFWSHYIDESNEALYPFGHGLSYTTFDYGELQLSKNTFSDGHIEARIKVTNSGNRAGREVVQFYIRDLAASRTRPIKELKGFEILDLEPGESREARFTINRDTLAFYSGRNLWEAEAGEFKLFAGGSSETIRTADFSLVE